MTSVPPRMPPRYVPTLTEVVSAEQMAPPAPMLDDILAGTLQTVAPLSPPGVGAGRPDPAPMPITQPADVSTLEDELVHRVLQRIDVSIDHRLQVAVMRLVDEYTRQLAPRLRAEVAEVVRQAVSDALARELATPPAPRGAADARSEEL
jgi:hypothetical protein